MSKEQPDLILGVSEAVPAPDSAPMVPMVQQVSKEDALLATVLQTGNIEALERYIALREREEARQSKLEYDRHFSEMQAEFGSAKRTKEGYGYKYAPIEELQKEYGPIIAKHGFSYRWNEEKIEGGKRCTMTVSGWGHSESNSFDIPTMEAPVNREGKKTSNAVQVAGGMSTYGRRYTFIAGFGVIIEDEDPDAEMPEDVDTLTMDLREYIESGKLKPEAVNIITKELVKDSPDREKLRGYWKRARIKVEGK